MRIAAPTGPAGMPAAALSGRPVFSLRPARNQEQIDGSMPVWAPPQTAPERIAQSLSQAGSSPPSPGLNLAETPQASPDDTFGFLDLVDMINPLQHIPVVSTFYRALTGDTIKPVSEIVGGTIFGGVIGAAAGAIDALAISQTGKDIGGNIMGWFGDKTSQTLTRPPDTTLAVARLAYQTPHYNE